MKSISSALIAAASTLVLLSLSGCASTLDRLENVGKQPPLAKVQNPTVQPGYEPLSWPMPEAPPPGVKHANSLWQPGARAFFRDQRANRVGDILRVNIKIKDKAELDNETKASRDSANNLGAPSIFGLQGKLTKWLPGTQQPDNLLEIESEAENNGKGEIKREETIETQIAALVTQKLPNGNLVIDGKQEIRVNYEVREIGVQGVVRPEDINSDNTVDLAQIAEARVVYGGRGQITDMQQPRYGNQVIDILSPF